MASTVPPPGAVVRVNSTVPPPGVRVTSSAWVKTLKEEIKGGPDKADPSIFADADEDSEIRVPSQETLRVPSDISSTRILSNDSAIEALAAAALSDLPTSRVHSHASIGTVSLGDAAAATTVGQLSGQRTSTIEFLKKVGLLQSASLTTDSLVQKSLQDADPTLHQRKRPASPPKKESKDDMEVFDEKELKEWDILSGRGGKSNHHPGNKRFRQVVEEMKEKYRVTNVKTDKTALSKAIVAYVDGYGGRFLKKISPGKWRLMTTSESRKKTSQALRETKELKWKL